jgi:hypothetical protein
MVDLGILVIQCFAFQFVIAKVGVVEILESLAVEEYWVLPSQSATAERPTLLGRFAIPMVLGYLERSELMVYQQPPLTRVHPLLELPKQLVLLQQPFEALVVDLMQ